MSYISQDEIEQLIRCEKSVTEPPKQSMKSADAHLRNDMKLTALGGTDEQFRVFMRRSQDFPENFSIGLVYRLKGEPGEITLLRCNGQHGNYNATFDESHPHWDFHIHKASERAIEQGLRPECFAEKTTEYASYEEAIRYFVRRVNVTPDDISKHFPGARPLPLLDRGDS